MFELNQYEILCGDALDKLKELPDKSVQTCITSPPYYGLRDYGTGKWIGGDPNCPHKRINKYSESTTTGHAQEELKGNVGDAIYKTVCPICGAVREDKQVGLEETPEEYISRLVSIFREVKRILKDDGTLWVNIGDTYNASSYRKDENSSGHGKQGTNKGSYENIVERPADKNCKPKDLIGIPWMLAFALRADGWYLRQDIIWHKPNPMPEPVKDRCTKSHEYIFLLSKSPKYFFDYEAIQEEAKWKEDKRSSIVFSENSGIRFGGNKYGDNADPHYATKSGNECSPTVSGSCVVRNKRDVWSVIPSHYKEAHFATYPEELVEPMVLAGSKDGDIVLDPFNGSGTTGAVAMKHNRKYIGIELNPEYISITERRFDKLNGIEAVKDSDTGDEIKVKKVGLF